MKSKVSAAITEVFGKVESRREQRMVQIVEAAIRSYATVGVEETTFERLSQKCGVTRPLIHHYFDSKRALFDKTVRYIRAQFQQMAVEAILKQTRPTKQIEAYIAVTFDWIEKHPEHATVWRLFYYYCGIDKAFLKLNTELSDMGHDRITAILEAGVKQKEMSIAHPRKKAKALQVMILGMLMAGTTEMVNAASFRKQFTEECLDLLGLEKD
jgi:AcrR family transcriptional regulator